MPIVLSTVGVEFGFNGPRRDSILSELDGIEPIDRTSMNAFDDQGFRDAVKATGRKRLIIGGLHTEICLTNATTSALKDGYDAMFVTDAVGGRSQTAHRTAIGRLRTPVQCRVRRWRSSPGSSATGHRRSRESP